MLYENFMTFINISSYKPTNSKQTELFYTLIIDKIIKNACIFFIQRLMKSFVFYVYCRGNFDHIIILSFIMFFFSINYVERYF